MSNTPSDRDRIRPCAANPAYWQYKGKPVLLLGGSVEDNLFQIRDLTEHLDVLKNVGGNYVRGTMSSRDPGDVWPFGRAADGSGRYDLNAWSDEYWRRFEQFLRLAEERDIIVQIEVWDRFDFARAPWQDNPFNPKNNVNYNAANSGLAEAIETHPGRRENAFFRTVPELDDNRVVLTFQHAFVDKLLSHALRRANVLYCMDNEINEPPAWGAYWSRHIRCRADEAGVAVETTEMWDAHDVLDATHEQTWRHPELYSFSDISQNNHQSGRTHWERAVAYRARLRETGRLWPINCVKVYGADTGRYGSDRDAVERFWRNIFAGLAATRFHRPPTGLGLGETAQAHIRSARMLSDAMDVFTCEPHEGLLADAPESGAVCFAHPGIEYAVFLADGGRVSLDCAAVAGVARAVTVRWLDCAAGRWHEPNRVPLAARHLDLEPPGCARGYWAALVKPAT